MKLRHFLKIFFISIILLSLYFIFEQVQHSQLQLTGTHLSQKAGIIVILVGAILYAATCFILSYNWYKILTLISIEKTSFMVCNYIYSVSCLAKYVPGSILQYANRQMLGKIYGFPQINLIVASYMETVGFLLASSMLGIMCFLSIEMKDKKFIFFSIIFLILFIFGLLPIFYKFIKNHQYIKKVKWPKLHFRKLLPIFGYYFSFFIMSGILLILIIVVEKHTMSLYQAIMIISIWSLAWLAGYLVILVPAGLGVREAVLIALLTPILANHMAIIATVLFRISLVMGDVLFAMIGWIGTLKPSNQKQ